jgi:hypothetical protein
MKQFQVVTYSNDIGADEKMDFDGFQSALKEAKKYRKTEEYAAIYDRFMKVAFVVFGDISAPVFRDDIHVFSLR